MQTTNAKRPDAAHIMDLAARLGTAVGTSAYMAAHRELEEAVYTALHQPVPLAAIHGQAAANDGRARAAA